MQIQINSDVLVNKMWPQTGITRSIILMAAGSWLIAMTAQITFPILPVPITGQTFGVLIIAALLGSRLGVGAVLAYLMQGAMGMPFFAGGMGGTAVFLGPTAGYLVGFAAAALVVGSLAERGWDRTFERTAGMMLMGTAVITLFGLLWLAQFTSWQQAFTLGAMPFIPSDILKILLAAALLPAGSELLGK